jgi:hypothetical protein
MRVRTFSCAGAATGEGTGFLVGTSVVMTARHVVRGACRVRVMVDGGWENAAAWKSWYHGGGRDTDTGDVATIKLPGASSGHVFTIRSRPAGLGANVAAIGYPLGSGISLTQGHVVRKGKAQGIPLLAVRLLGAEGGSGSPLVDDSGSVVGILERGLAGTDVLGPPTAGLLLGVDLPSWWSSAKRGLCGAYPNGGMPGCASAAKPTPAPAPLYTVSSCWVQYAAEAWGNVSSSAAVTTLSSADLLARGPKNFWSVVLLAGRPRVGISGVAVSLVQPSGRVFATQSLPQDWGTTSDRSAANLAWYFNSDKLWFFQHPETTGQGAWAMVWRFPDGQSCTATFTVSP